MCFGVRVAFSTNENPDRPVQTHISLCYEYVRKSESTPDPQTHSHSPWVTVYDEKLLAR